MIIRHAKHSDIPAIHELEKSIEKEHAATIETLINRLEMYPEGFYVVCEDHKIVAYMESCLWDKMHFERFEEIKDFPKYHDPKGKTLYLIYIAVDKRYRRRAIGSALIKTLKDHALKKGLQKIQLVAAEGFIVDFYKGLGFKPIIILPDFLPHICGTLMEYSCQESSDSSVVSK